MLSDHAHVALRAAVQSRAEAAPSHRSRRRAARAAATRRSHALVAVIAAEARLPTETETEAPAALLKSQRKSPDRGESMQTCRRVSHALTVPQFVSFQRSFPLGGQERQVPQPFQISLRLARQSLSGAKQRKHGGLNFATIHQPAR